MQSYHTIGIMSGTSLDGLDIIFAKFEYDHQWKFEIIKCETFAYNDDWTNKLSNAHTLSGIELQKLHKEYGRFIGLSINSFLSDVNQKIDFIASHGHTIFHQPEKKITLQIGDGAEIASTTNITTISDFRSLDVALGGQGAPLVPIGDELLFPEYDFCLNIGGFANISFQDQNKRLAYDICPANIIINFLANKLGHSFDENGKLGNHGSVNKKLLEKLNNLHYYQLPFPKSLGREWLNELFIPILSKSDVPLCDQITTIYEHIADQITLAIHPKNQSKVLITGGGAFNTFLMERIKAKTNSEIIIPNQKIIEFKEALIFAFLGLLRLNNQVNCLSSVTGAKKDSSGGIVHLMNNK